MQHNGLDANSFVLVILYK